MLAPSETIQHLQAARALIADPERWCQEKYCVDDRYCAMGAASMVQGRDPDWYSMHEGDAVFDALSDAARELFGMFIAQVNDKLGHDAVLRIFDRAIALATPGVSRE